MKRGARLAVLAVALAVLVGAWLLAESMTRHREEQQAVEAMAEETMTDGDMMAAGEAGF